jgi:HlyD family secretion protein
MRADPIPAAEPGATPPPPGARLRQLRIERDAPALPRHRRRRGLWLLGAAALAAAAWFALAPRPAEVEVAAVVARTPSQQLAELTASGYVVAQRRAAVASKATGRLVELNVREGSRVKAGEVIARLDAADVQAQIAAARAAVGEAQARIAQAEADARNAEAELRRSRQLVAQQFLSAAALDVSLARAGAARAAVASARAARARAEAELRLQEVNRDYAEIRAPFDGVVLVKNANVGDIITPFSSAAGAQGAVVTMADMGTLEVEADVSESNVARVRIGQPVEITLDALPDARFRGEVASIVPTVDRAKATVMTKIRFESLDPRVLPEMSAKVACLSRPASDADPRPVLAAPPGVVVTRDGRAQVLRLARGTDAEAPAVLEAVPVVPGRRLGELQELGAAPAATPAAAPAAAPPDSPPARAPAPADGPVPLSAGDRLVLQPADSLRAGQPVRPAAPAGAAK